MLRRRLVVYELPAPQGSKSAFVVWPKGGGKPRAVITDGGSSSTQRRKLTAWRKAIVATAQNQVPGPAMTGPVRVRAVFYLPRPKSLAAWRWLPWQKPDLDKLVRSTLDGLRDADVYVDDAQVVELLVRKLFALVRDPGALLVVESLEAEERERGSAWAVVGGPPPTLR